MIRALGLSAIIALLASPGYAQDNFVQENGPKPTRRATHYVGIQANQLVKQLLNLGGSSSAVNNPYLVSYSVNSNDTGVGLNLSVGYQLDETSGGDFQSQVNTRIEEFFFRIGVEKKLQIGKRWILSAGGDIVVENKSDRTETLFVGSDAPSVETDKAGGFGTGPRVSLNFNISEKVLLGTEANYYFKLISTSNTLTQPFGTPVRHSDDKTKFQLSVPAVLFLIVKF